MKRKGQHAGWVEEVGILGSSSSPDTKLKKKEYTNPKNPYNPYLV